MARFDVHRMPGARARGFVVDVQAELLEGLGTRVIVPLLPATGRRSVHPDLNPVFEIGGVPHALEPQGIGTVSRGALGPPLANLDRERDAITRALDILLTGF